MYYGLYLKDVYYAFKVKDNILTLWGFVLGLKYFVALA